MVCIVHVASEGCIDGCGLCLSLRACGYPWFMLSLNVVLKYMACITTENHGNFQSL